MAKIRNSPNQPTIQFRLVALEFCHRQGADPSPAIGMRLNNPEITSQRASLVCYPAFLPFLDNVAVNGIFRYEEVFQLPENRPIQNLALSQVGSGNPILTPRPPITKSVHKIEGCIVGKEDQWVIMGVFDDSMNHVGDDIVVLEGPRALKFDLKEFRKQFQLGKEIAYKPVEIRWSIGDNDGSRKPLTDHNGKNLITPVTICFSGYQPTYPWVDIPFSTKILPWDFMIEEACKWAAGAGSIPEILHLLIRSIWTKGVFIYSREAEPYATVDSSIGETLQFNIRLLRNDLIFMKGSNLRANCLNLSQIIILFANALGCRVKPLKIKLKTGHSLDPKKVHFLGGNCLEEVEFSYHEVVYLPSTWGQPSGLIYDPCLNFDGNDCGVCAMTIETYMTKLIGKDWDKYATITFPYYGYQFPEEYPQEK